MDYKKAFFSKLEDCYLGAKIKNAQNSITQNSTNASGGKANANSIASGANTSIAQSGFTNLLHIKAQYFAHIKAHLELRINELVGDDSIESNDIYNKLYTFFDSYLNETGTPFFTDTPIYKNIYAKVYSNSKDTSLFYKTQNLYYVKSDTLYQSLTLQDNEGGFSIFFDASEYRQNADNNKSKVVFKLDSISPVIASEQSERGNPQDENPTHPLTPSAQGGGIMGESSAREGKPQNPSESSTNENQIPQITIKVTNQKDLFPDFLNVFKTNSNEFSDDFIKALIDKNLLPKKPTDSHLESLKKLFSSYKKQNEIDFFIHKDAKAFLQEQFDLWMFSYLYKDSAFQQWNNVAISRLQQVKNLAYEIIEFIARFEDELKAIWLKPKFAKKTEYVFSIEVILANAYKDSPSNAEDSLLSPSLAEDSPIIPPPCAEGIRGWVSRSEKLDTLLGRIFSDSHFEAQIKEWKELNLVDEDFSLKSLKDFIKCCHTERSEVSHKSDNRDSSVATQPQNDKNLDCHESAIADSRNDDSVCHTEGEARSISKDSKNRDISAFSKPQYDKDLNAQNEKYKFLPIDTKHLSKETKFALLSAFDDVESLLNGELIKSDNFQALNSIMPKYQNKIDLIYIDPPYNAPASEIIYKNNFKDSTWIAMMQNRLAIAKSLLSQRGILTCAIDENEQENLGLLLSDIFSEYEKTCVSVVHNPSGIQGDNFSYSNEFAYFMYPNIKNIIQGIAREDSDIRNLRDVTGVESVRTAAKNCFYPIYVKDSKIIGFGEVCADDFHPSANVIRDDGVIEIYPIDPQGIERKWRFARQTIETIKHELFATLIKGRNVWDIKRIKNTFRPKTAWFDSKYSANNYGVQILNNILPNNTFDFPKSIHTVKDSIYLASKEDSIVLDFFGGSGTTAHAVLELNKQGSNRKFILVEMGEHFYSVILPRIKKVAFSSEWKEGKLKENKQVNPIAIAFRYYELESYEEALANCEYVLNSSVVCHTERSEVSQKYNNRDSSLSAKAQNDKDIDCHESAIEDSRNDGIISPSLAESDIGGGYHIIDYRKSRKLIKELNKECDKPITLNMSGYRAEFDIFQSIANLMGWKIKRLFLDKSTHPLAPSAQGGGRKDKNSASEGEEKASISKGKSANAESVGIESCEYHNGEILNLESIDIAKYPKLKNLIWWE